MEMHFYRSWRSINFVIFLLKQVRAASRAQLALVKILSTSESGKTDPFSV
jgi:hypothetical protein